MPGYTFSQLTEVPIIMRVIQEYNAPGTSFSRFYGLGLRDKPRQVLPKRIGVYDIFNPTRTMPVGRANLSGPSRVARKPIGQKMIATARFYEAIEITYEDVYGHRPLGGQYGEVDAMGESYIARQVTHELDKFGNLHEFLAFQAMRGGWSYIAPNGGEDLFPVLKGTADSVLDVDTLVPPENQGQLEILGAAGDPVIDVSWDDPTAKVVNQLLQLNKAHAVRNGTPLRHIWLNGSTITYLFENNQLRDIGGDAYTLFEFMSDRPADPNQKYPDTGFDVVFRALPGWRFHVYNQAYIPGLVSESKEAQTSFDNIRYHIPDDEIIITPEPGDWCEKIAGSEPFQANPFDKVERVSGFHMGRTFEIDPPRVDLRFLENYAPVLTQESPVYNATVKFA